MSRAFIILILIPAAFWGCRKKDKPQPPPPGDTTVNLKPSTQHVSMLTQHVDNTRAGLNNMETELTTANVNTSSFGKLFTLSVDDQVYAQPLVVGNLPVSSGTHNVVFIATVNNTIYAFDADNGKAYWHVNYTATGMRPPVASDVNSGWCNPYGDFTKNMGLVGTPVIDSAAQTMYFVARSTDGNHFVQYLHAINITDGSEQSGSPVQISASVNGTGDGAVGGKVNFDPLRNNQRQPLLLLNGTVYISFSSHCDWNPYHGWILGYDAKTLQQKIVYNDTPSGEAGGLWESGMGIAADQQGNIYVVSGNGTVGEGGHFKESGNGTDEQSPNPNPSDPENRSESAIKLTPSGSTLTVSSFFTPTNYLNLNNNDLDYGVMGAFLIPNSNYYITGGKDGNVYLLNTSNMGGYSGSGNQVAQTIPLGVSLHCQPSYYQGQSAGVVYIWSENDKLRAFQFSNGSMSTNPTLATPSGPSGYSGPALSVSSNGTKNGTRIVWASCPLGNAAGALAPGALYAFDATDVTKTLWSSKQKQGDAPGFFAKFCAPTVVDGHVYLATFSNKVVVYGLK
jgi:outer membrane protein assembly factor BamB